MSRTTGVTAAVVERMEEQLKQDVLQEIRRGDGRMLLHDEVETKPGVYEIIPIWEQVEEHEVMTPKELYEGVMREDYQVDYARVAIVSDQRRFKGDEFVLTTRRTSKHLCPRLCRPLWAVSLRDWMTGKTLCKQRIDIRNVPTDHQLQLSNGQRKNDDRNGSCIAYRHDLEGRAGWECLQRKPGQ